MTDPAMARGRGLLVTVQTPDRPRQRQLLVDTYPHALDPNVDSERNGRDGVGEKHRNLCCRLLNTFNADFDGGQRPK